MLKNKVILIVSPEHWENVKVSKHHYAINLSSINNVYYLNPPAQEFSCESSSYKNLNIVSYKGFLRGFRFFPYLLKKIVFRSVFRKIEDTIKMKIDVVWSFENAAFFDFSLLPKNVFSISHIVDLNMNFNFAKATKTADLVLTCNSAILNRQKEFNHNSYFINHGYDDTIVPEQFQIKQSEDLKVGYAGNLSIPYIDKKLLREVIEKYPQITFYFAGSGQSSWLVEFENVVYIGQLSKEELYYFYGTMDILVLAYLSKEFEKQLSNPHKMMEYLGSGKPIVATYTHEFRNEIDLISMENKDQGYIEAFNKLIENLEFWNAKKKQEKRIAFAKDNSYKKQILRIDKLIEKVAKGSI